MIPSGTSRLKLKARNDYSNEAGPELLNSTVEGLNRLNQFLDVQDTQVDGPSIPSDFINGKLKI